MPRNASNKTIRAAFRKTAKELHPDLNAGDPIAEQQLREVIEAYEILKNPQRKAAYDQHLAARDRNRRRERVRRFAAPAVAGLVSGSIVATVVWAAVLLSQTQEAFSPLQTLRFAVAKLSQSVNPQIAATDDNNGRQEAGRGRKSDRDADASSRRFSEQFTTGLQPADGQARPKTRLAQEWEQVQAGGDVRAIWAFAVRNPDTPESALARLKLIGLIDAAEDVPLLHLLRLVATDAIAERAQQRLIALGVPAVATAESVASDAPSSSAPLQAAVNETTDAANRAAVAEEGSAASDAPSSNSPLQAAVGETIEPVNREQPTAQKTPERPRTAAKRRATNPAPAKQASSENRNTAAAAACSASQACSGYASPPLFGVGF